MENADGSDSDDSGDDNFLSKRRKFSDSLGSRTDLSSHNGRSQHSPSSISEDAKSDDFESTTVDSSLATIASSSLGRVSVEPTYQSRF